MSQDRKARALDAPAPRSTRATDVLRGWEHDAVRRLERHPRTVSHVLRAIEELTRSAGTDDLAEITTDHVLTWLTVQPSAKTACNKRTCASSVFRYMQMRGLLASNPVSSVVLPRPRAGRGADPITHAEFQRLVSVAERDNGDRRATGPARARFYRFLWVTALRLGEGKAQAWADVLWNQGALRVTHDKSRRGDIIPVPEWLLKDMREWPRGGARIFAATPSHHSLRRDFEAAGINGKGGWHRFRKGAITHLAAGGVPVHVLAKLSRHRNISVLVNSYITVEWAQLSAAQRLMAG
jgi:integrase